MSRLLVVTLCGLLALAASMAPAQEPSELFTPVGGSFQAATVLPSDALSAERVTVNPAALSAGQIVLHLGGVTYVADAVGQVGSSRRFRIEGKYPALVTEHDGYIAGSFFTPYGVYTMGPSGDGHVVYEADPSWILKCDAPNSLFPGVAGLTRQLQGVEVSSEQTADLMLLYVPELVGHYGGVGQAETVFTHGADYEQFVLENSKASARIRLVHVGMAPADLGGLNSSELFGAVKSDGHPAVTALRNKYGADLVGMISYEMSEQRSGSSSGVYSGLGGVTPREFGYFTIVGRTAYGVNSALAHEVGHSLGIGHEVGDSNPYGFFSYSHAVCNTENHFRTATSNCSGMALIPNYSNSGVMYEGVPTGIIGVAEGVLTIDQTILIVTAYLKQTMPDIPARCDSPHLIPMVDLKSGFGVITKVCVAIPDGEVKYGRLVESIFNLPVNHAMVHFFGENNIEVLMKLLNGCTINESFWVFFSGLTTLEVWITVQNDNNVVPPPQSVEKTYYFAPGGFTTEADIGTFSFPEFPFCN